MSEGQEMVLANLDPVSRNRLLLQSYEDERAELNQQAREKKVTLERLRRLQDVRESEVRALNSEVRALTNLIERTRKRLSDAARQEDEHKEQEPRSDAPTDQEPRSDASTGQDGEALTASVSKELVLDSPAEDLSDWSRTAAISHVLERASEPLAPATIADLLSEAGRDDEASVVSAALDYLRRKHRAHRVGRGQWMAGPEPDSDDGRAAFDAASGPVIALTPQGGDATHALATD